MCTGLLLVSYDHGRCCSDALLSITGAGLLHPPSDVSVDSVNMKHRLTWRPPEVSCATVSYSVQFQGEFELRILNGSWEEVQACQRIGACVCDLSDHLASDSDYELRVRAECGGAVSRWARPAMPFNRKQSEMLARTHAYLLPSMSLLRAAQVKSSIVCVATLVTMALLGGLLWCVSRVGRSLVHSCYPQEPLPAALVSGGASVHTHAHARTRTHICRHA
uniref:Interleukin-20 receptor subunit beta n=1 Tax=Scleropages formosus TaxID=113540 RepID=A0A8C9VMP8_SCLFO